MKVENLRGVLLDIEGTTSPVSYVFDVLFPFARRHAGDYLRDHWSESSCRHALELMAKDAGFDSLEKWLAGSSCTGSPFADSPFMGSPDTWNFEAAAIVLAEVERLMDGDIKATGLKELQGLIWKIGYGSGQLVSLVFEDVPVCIEAWRDAGLNVSIYSSGSVGAQKTFFAHTKCGDLTRKLVQYFDTTSGGKRDAQSYQTIAAALQIEPSQILFLSDIVAELDAARAAGMKTALVLRDGNAPQKNSGHPEIQSFQELELQPDAQLDSEGRGNCSKTALASERSS